MNHTLLEISRHEVLHHNTMDDCWLIIYDDVYDFSKFMQEHPGGRDVLMLRAGEDASSYFTAKHGNNKQIIKHLEKLKIGTLPAHEKIHISNMEEPFMQELLDAIYKNKLFKIPKFYKNTIFWVRSLNILVYLVCFYISFFTNTPIWIAMMLVIVQAVVSCSLFGLIAHEATHRNFATNNFQKILLKIFWPIFWPFINQYGLNYEHNSHHIKIGDADYDYEVAAFAAFIRYSGQVPYKPQHKYQYRTAKFIYPFYANIITTIGGIKSSFWSSHNRKIALRHNLTLLYSLAILIILPYCFSTHSLLWHIMLYGIYQCVLFYCIYVSSAINHFVPQIAQPIPTEYHNKYAYYICHNTTNFCIESKFWRWFTGGFNIQIEHHLIPFVPVENLHKLIPIVQKLCTKYSYPYTNYSNVLKLWNAHYVYLYELSKDTDTPFIKQEKLNKKSYTAR